MGKIAADTPKELIDIAEKIDTTSLSPIELKRKLDQLAFEAVKYIPIRTGKVGRTITIRNPKVDQKLLTLVSKFDFSKVGKAKKMLALPLIKTYLKNEGFLK